MNICVVGLQWGDEGKGKIVDILSESADLVVRFNGGANAGHTVVRSAEEEAFALHLLPSGILRENVLSVIANGVALDGEVLLGEIAGLQKRGIKVADNLRISDRAHMVMVYHKKQDQLSEQSLGKGKIGTTMRGIGPCYADKISRTSAVRVGDLLHLASLRERLERIVATKNKVFGALYGDQEPLKAAAIYEQCCLWAKALGPYITDTTALLHGAMAQGESLLFEGAQGSLLDIDHGTFPYVTSSNCCALGLGPGSGVPAKAVDRWVGVVKAYTSRVGEGPFPTEQDNAIGEFIRERGHEYGTTTGRPRRCGWFDAVGVGYAARISGIDEITMLHLDTLSGLEELKICCGYSYRGQKLESFPADSTVLNEVECQYESLDGFDQDVTAVTEFAGLPKSAQDYVLRVEEVLGVPVKTLGVGPGRNQTLRRA